MSKIKVLYLSYTGLLEPLGRSQILAYLSRLADEYQFTIISFEKASDLAKTDELQALKTECEHYGIHWQPKTYHHKPRLLATLWDLSALLYYTWQFSRSNRAHHIHCRSYIPAIAAWVVGKQTQVPFIFDMRALWLEEMIEAGRLVRHSVVHKVLAWLETKLLKDAAHVVSLTEAAVDYLQQQQPQLRTQKFSVITTCVDLERFKLSTIAIEDRKLGTMGTVISGWYHLDWLFSSLKTQLQKDKSATFKIVTRDSAQTLRTMARKYEIEPSKLEVFSSSPNDIAKNIADIKAGLLYFTAGISKLGSAPTRLGEFLACGIPVIGNRGVGDMASLIERYQVGVVIEDGSQRAIDEALEKLDILYQDNQLSQRCRDAAEDYFSADKGAERYRQIYRGITSHEKDKVLKVALFSRHTRMGASSRLRSMQYLPFLEDKKITVDVFPLYDSDYLRQLYAGKGRSTAKVLQCYLARLYKLFTLKRYDVIWIEKELFPYLPAWAEALIAKLGKPYVVDYDDAVFHNYDLSNHKMVRLLLSNKISKVMHNAATVIAGNAYLAERAASSASKKVVIIPTVLDNRRYQAIETDNEVPIIGWIGSPTTEKYVLELKEMFLELQKKISFKIHLVGSTQQMQDKLDGLEVEILSWSESTEASYIEQFDIGIMPLIDGPWERGKCGYKLLQYMACAKPVVASPVGVNVDIITSCECGYLANSLEQWDRALYKLLHSKERRQLLGDAGKKSVRDFYSLQVQAPLLADVFKLVSHR